MRWVQLPEKRRSRPFFVHFYSLFKLLSLLPTELIWFSDWRTRFAYTLLRLVTYYRYDRRRNHSNNSFVPIFRSIFLHLSPALCIITIMGAEVALKMRTRRWNNRHQRTAAASSNKSRVRIYWSIRQRGSLCSVAYGLNSARCGWIYCRRYFHYGCI